MIQIPAAMMAKQTNSQMLKAAKYSVILKMRRTLSGSPLGTPMGRITTIHAGARRVATTLLHKVIPGQAQHVKVKDILCTVTTFLFGKLSHIVFLYIAEGRCYVDNSNRLLKHSNHLGSDNSPEK